MEFATTSSEDEVAPTRPVSYSQAALPVFSQTRRPPGFLHLYTDSSFGLKFFPSYLLL
jgi:hypothetical protein